MKNLRLQLPLIATLLILTVLFPAIQVQGELTADFSISVVDKDDISENHWEVYRLDDISFIGSGDEVEGFTWDFGEGEPEYREVSTISHNYSAVGKYQVVLTVNDEDNETASKWGNITVVERPEVHLVVRDKDGNALGPTDSVKVGDTVILDASGSKGHIIFYVFGYDLPNAFLPQVSDSNSSYSHTYQVAGVYKVGLRVTDEIGKNDQMEKSEFITIEVKKGGSDSGSGASIPVGNEVIVGGVALILVIILVMFLWRNGYIGGMGGGDYAPPPPPPPAQQPGMATGGPARSLNTLMDRPGGNDPVLPDPSSFMQEKSSQDFGKPPADQTVYEVKTCPKCKGKIPITSLDRPLKVSCPSCTASFTLKGKPQTTTPQPSPAMAPAGPEPKKDFIYDFKDCPKCKSKIPITSQERPFKVTCPGCAASFTLKGKSGGASAPASAPKSSAPPAPADDTEIVICPACGKAQPVSASANAANCVSCNARFEL